MPSLAQGYWVPWWVLRQIGADEAAELVQNLLTVLDTDGPGNAAQIAQRDKALSARIAPHIKDLLPKLDTWLDQNYPLRG